jgi:hypothetical protein
MVAEVDRVITLFTVGCFCRIDLEASRQFLEPRRQSSVDCFHRGVYKSLSSQVLSPVFNWQCANGGLRTLTIGCETSNRSELVFSSSCRHDLVPDVQVITSIRGICLASWRHDHRFQRTLVLYDDSKAFCLVSEHVRSFVYRSITRL